VSAQFRFLSGARAGQVDTFRKAYIGLGRHPLSDVRFDIERDLDVSVRHANVIRHGEAFVLRDLESTNGTFVNGQRIAGDVTLKDGDVIAFGQNGPAVEFHVLPGEADAAAASQVRRTDVGGAHAVSGGRPAAGSRAALQFGGADRGRGSAPNVSPAPHDQAPDRRARGRARRVRLGTMAERRRRA
jgi:hypothetical protein